MLGQSLFESQNTIVNVLYSIEQGGAVTIGL